MVYSSKADFSWGRAQHCGVAHYLQKKPEHFVITIFKYTLKQFHLQK